MAMQTGSRRDADIGHPCASTGTSTQQAQSVPASSAGRYQEGAGVTAGCACTKHLREVPWYICQHLLASSTCD